MCWSGKHRKFSEFGREEKRPGMSVIIRLPNDDRYEIEYSDILTCSEIYGLISKLSPKNYVNPIRGKCFYQGRYLENDETLSACGIGVGAMIEILDDFEPLSHESELCYDPFIQSTTPVNHEEGVSVDKQPTIYFKENNYGLAIYLQCLINRDFLRSDIAGDMEKSLGHDEAVRRGFVKWTDTTFNRSIFLLEVTNPNLEKTIESVRYNYFGINQYYDGGDRHSWQRYSEKMPIECFLHIDDIDNKIRLVPELRLTPDTTYCIVLQNGVPTPPADELLSSLFNYTGRGLCEDKVIFFRTHKTRAFRASMFG